jgi:pimeloyl-ACP methyl ester carboxylesterase
VIVTAADGVELYVEVHGDGDPVLLLHGWPDSGLLWRDQVPRLAAAGFRVIVPDLRGFGRSGRPEGRDAYKLARSVADVATVLDAAGAPAAHVVGHDWGAALAWTVAMFLPDRVQTLAALSVPHPGAREGMRQLEMAWYRLFFQFEDIAEANLSYDDWALLRELTPGYRDIDRAIADLSRPGALTATLNWYRANTAPRLPGPPRPWPPIACPVLGVWSDGDRYLDGDRMRASRGLVDGPWRYAEIAGASHWIPLDAPDELATLLLEWLSGATRA